jgi:hypothetical protein
LLGYAGIQPSEVYKELESRKKWFFKIVEIFQQF